MVRYFKYKFSKDDVLTIIIDDIDLDYKLGIEIKYSKNNKIKSVLLMDKEKCNVALKDAEYFLGKEIDEFELIFDKNYKALLIAALKKHNEKFNYETILNKVIKKYNILNLNEV